MPRKPPITRTKEFWHGLMWPHQWYDRTELREMSGLKKKASMETLDLLARTGVLDRKESPSGRVLYKRTHSFPFLSTLQLGRSKSSEDTQNVKKDKSKTKTKI